MIWAVDPVEDKAFWWSGQGWMDSTMKNGCLKYFKMADHLHPVSLYQIRANNVRPYKPL